MTKLFNLVMAAPVTTVFIKENWGRSSAWLERRPVTAEAASSNLVDPVLP